MSDSFVLKSTAILPRLPIRNQQAGGSNPPIGSIKTKDPPYLAGFVFSGKKLFLSFWVAERWQDFLGFYFQVLGELVHGAPQGLYFDMGIHLFGGADIRVTK
jgi:hypothetical protein